MKKILLLAVLLSAVALSPCSAQTGRYYLDGREVTREALRKLPAEAIERMVNSVEDGVPVIRMTLKPDYREAAAHVLATAGEPDTQTTDADTEALRASAIRKARELLRNTYEQHTRLKEGDRAADFTAAKYAGGELSLAALRGKVVLLNFWATWCGPCLRELAPEALPKVILERFAENADFVFLPVAYTDSQASLDKFFASDKAENYIYLRDCTAMDPDKAVFSLFADQGVPRSFVIGRNGRIVLGSLGAMPEELERIAAAIEKALAE